MTPLEASAADIDRRATRIARILRRELGDEVDFIDAAAHIEIGVRAAKLIGLPLHAIIQRIAVVYANAPTPQAGDYVDTTGEGSS